LFSYQPGVFQSHFVFLSRCFNAFTFLNLNLFGFAEEVGPNRIIGRYIRNRGKLSQEC